jgi:hypothetical protein
LQNLYKLQTLDLAGLTSSDPQLAGLRAAFPEGMLTNMIEPGHAAKGELCWYSTMPARIAGCMWRKRKRFDAKSGASISF